MIKLFFRGSLASKLAKEAIPTLRLDAEKDARSASALAALYRNGIGVKQDPVAAFRYYKSAANRGHVRAIAWISDCYFNGTGVPRDKSKGIEWLKRAADHGDTLSMVILGERYAYGDDGPENPALACF